jgi:uncharacterized protein (DUF1330 family)
LSAYVIVDIQVTNPQIYEDYKKLAPACVAAYGGEYLARGGQTEVLEGEWAPSRLVILRFDRCEQVKKWLNSPEYTPVKALRYQSTHTNMVVIEGI